MAVPCKRGGLEGCRVECFLGALQVFVQECGFMEQQIDSSDQGRKSGQIAGVRAIGIAAGWSGRGREAGARDDLPVLGDPILSILYIVDFADRDVVEVYHVPPDMGKQLFFLEQVAATSDAVAQGDGIDHHGTVFVD